MQGDRRATCQMQTSLGIQTGKALKSDCECLTDYKNTSDCMKRTQKATHTHTRITGVEASATEQKICGATRRE